MIVYRPNPLTTSAKPPFSKIENTRIGIWFSRASEIAVRNPQPAILLITGTEDDPAFPLQAQRLQAELRQQYRDPQRAGLTSIPGMKHAFAAEPGIEPAPQTREAKLVDAAVADWFSRYLR